MGDIVVRNIDLIFTYGIV